MNRNKCTHFNINITCNILLYVHNPPRISISLLYNVLLPQNHKNKLERSHNYAIPPSHNYAISPSHKFGIHTIFYICTFAEKIIIRKIKPMTNNDIFLDRKKRILLQAEILMNKNNLLIEQCNSWLPEEEGDENMKRRIMEKKVKIVVSS